MCRSSSRSLVHIFPQIAIAIGFLLPTGGEGDEPLWRIGRGTRVPLQGAVDAVDMVPLLGAIVGCHCRGGRGAIAGCHCSVLWWGRGG